MKLCMKIQRPKPFTFCLKLLPFVDLDLFYGKVKFCKFFTMGNVTMMDSLEIIASCDLEFG